jgi:hypothetical protein
MPGPGEQHGGAGTVLGLVGKQRVVERWRVKPCRSSSSQGWYRVGKRTGGEPERLGGRRLRVHWEIRDDIYEAFLSLACGIICWRRLANIPLC